MQVHYCRSVMKSTIEMRKMRMANSNKKSLKKDSYHDPIQHQQRRIEDMFVSREMLPIYNKLDEILKVLKEMRDK